MRCVQLALVAATAAAAGAPLGGCGHPAAGGDAAPATDAGAALDAGTAPGALEWDPRLPPTSRLATYRGLRPARGIIHLHTIHSHDACDGAPVLADGTPNEPCNQDLRRGLCLTREDYALYTDHPTLLGTTSFEDALLIRAGDEPVTDPATGAHVANVIVCEDGHRVFTMVGMEDELMPVAFSAHPDVPVGPALEDFYNQYDADTALAEAEAGALVLVAHSEGRTLDYLLGLPLVGFEIYNLHANVDPDIRVDSLGQTDPFGAITAIATFAQSHDVPDLAWLAFFFENRPSLELFDQVLAERPAVGTLGTDAHQNSVPFLFSDGERGDSYRRMMRWFSNVLLVPEGAALAPDVVRGALAGGRVYGAFEIYGTPDGFDYHAEDAGGATSEMGDHVSLTAAPVLHVTAPHVLDLDPRAAPPPVTIELVWASAAGPVVVAESGPDEDLAYTPTDPGAYRVVVYVTPTHLSPFLGADAGDWIARFPWIYANPIYVEP
ncbi:MAG TPA: hypothetical protein VG389_09040 [Myxococcota bacterium]|jgi:hypothetical protein|nr:hypothetical protein [Myxococcota bacterium]